MWHQNHLVLATAQLSPILSPSHFCHILLLSAATFSSSSSICVALDSLSCLVNTEGLELPISTQLVRQGSSFFGSGVCSCFRSRNGGLWLFRTLLLYRLLMWGLCLQQLWPVAPLFHWRSCATSWSLSLDSSVLIWASGVARILIMLGHRKGIGCGKMTTELNSDHRSVTTLAYPLIFNLLNYKSCFTSHQALSK